MSKRPPIDNRTALEKLVDMSGLTLHEIAEVMSFSISTAHTRINDVTRWKDQKEIERFRAMISKRIGREVTLGEMFPEEAPRMR